MDYVAERGIDLFRAVCAQDLEGIVAKRAAGLYTPDETSWVKSRTGTTARTWGGASGSRNGGGRFTNLQTVVIGSNLFSCCPPAHTKRSSNA